MFEDISIRTESEAPLIEFLQSNDFFVEKITDKVLRASRSGALPVFLNAEEKSIYFEVDLGNISNVATQELYHKLLDLNTEILPVSIGINSTNADDPRLVLVESREVENLDENDPRQAAQLMRKFSSMTGMELGEGMQQAIDRMEAGEDPEAIEADMGDLMDKEEPFVLPGKKGARSLHHLPPRRDETLYEM